MHRCLYVSMYVCMYVCMYVSLVFMHLYRYAHVFMYMIPASSKVRGPLSRKNVGRGCSEG